MATLYRPYKITSRLTTLTIGERITRTYASDKTQELLATLATPAAVTDSRYIVTVRTIDNKGQRLLIPVVDIAYQYHYNKPTPADFVLTCKFTRKLPKTLTLKKFIDLLKSGNVLTQNVEQASEAIDKNAALGWIDTLKSHLEAGATISAYELLRERIGFDCLTNNQRLHGNRPYYAEFETLNSLLTALNINARLYADTLQSIAEYGHFEALDGYTVERVTDPDLITRYYADYSKSFVSCMKGFATPARIYQPHQEGSDQDTCLYILKKHGDYVARIIAREKTKKYALCYTDECSVTIERAFKLLGFNRDCSAMRGARLPLLQADNGAVYMPYLDGDCKDLFLVEDTAGDYLRIGKIDNVDNDGIKWGLERVGRGCSTQGFLQPTQQGEDRGFSRFYGLDHSYLYQDDEEDRFYCTCCEESYHIDDAHNLGDYDILCGSCYRENTTECENCENRFYNEDIDQFEVWNFRRDYTDTTCLCNHCAYESGDYWESPTDNTFFYIYDLKKHVTGQH